MRIVIPISKLSSLLGENRFENRASAWYELLVLKMRPDMDARADRWRSAAPIVESGGAAGVATAAGAESSERVAERERKGARKTLERRATELARATVSAGDAQVAAALDAAVLSSEANGAAEDRLRAAKLKAAAAAAAPPSALSEQERAAASREVDSATIALALARAAAASTMATSRGTAAEARVRTDVERVVPDGWQVSGEDVLPWFFRAPLPRDVEGVTVMLVGKCDGYVHPPREAGEPERAPLPLEIKTRVDRSKPCIYGPWPNERVQLQAYMARRGTPEAFFVQRTSMAPTTLANDGTVHPASDGARFLVVHRVRRDDDFLREVVWGRLCTLVEAAVTSLREVESAAWRNFVLGSDVERERILDAWCHVEEHGKPSDAPPSTNDA